MIRLFIALPLPDDALAHCLSVAASIRRELGPLAEAVRFPRAEGMHFTLKFLGDTPEGLVGAVAQALAGVANATRDSAPVTLSGLDGFPNLKRPRVVYLGVRNQGGELDWMGRLAARIEDALVPLGFVREHRPFTPHLTLFRVSIPRDAAAIGHRLMHASAGPAFVYSPNEVALIQSRLAPGGSVYTRLASFPIEHTGDVAGV